MTVQNHLCIRCVLKSDITWTGIVSTDPFLNFLKMVLLKSLVLNWKNTFLERKKTVSRYLVHADY